VIYVANVDEGSVNTGNKYVEALKAAIATENAQLVVVQEVRAWTIKKGWKAPQAAGVIHTDFEKGFIKAEVIKLADYKIYKTELACKEAGKMSIEGKE